MALMINDNCEVCDACVLECPNEAISEGDPYVIDPMRCTECVGEFDTPQCQLVCPVEECIVSNPDFVESRDELQLKYDSLHG